MTFSNTVWASQVATAADLPDERLDQRARLPLEFPRKLDCNGHHCELHPPGLIENLLILMDTIEHPSASSPRPQARRAARRPRIASMPTRV